MSFAENLKIIRKYRGMTQKELSEVSGVSTATELFSVEVPPPTKLDNASHPDAEMVNALINAQTTVTRERFLKVFFIIFLPFLFSHFFIIAFRLR